MLKPSRLSSSAISRASLMGSLRGASASGYFALPITSAIRSAPAAPAGTIGASDKIEIKRNARRILIRRRSSQQGADPSLRLNDLTLRKPHYQTGCTSPVNCLQYRRQSRQFTATRAAEYLVQAARYLRGFSARRFHAGLTFGDDSGLVLASADPAQRKK